MRWPFVNSPIPVTTSLSWWWRSNDEAVFLGMESASASGQHASSACRGPSSLGEPTAVPQHSEMGHDAPTPADAPHNPLQTQPAKALTAPPSENGSHSITLSPSSSSLQRLPSELLYQILSYLSARDLAAVSTTCRILAEHTSDDHLWADLVNAELPIKQDTPGVFASFRKLYAAHYPCWFIPRNKIWFSDTEHTGTLILARYDPRRGVIEAYRVLAERQSNASLQLWQWNPEVIAHSFNPKVFLWFDDPVLCLRPSADTNSTRPRYLHGEIRMPMALESQSVFTAFALCSNKSTLPPYTRAENLWPPRTIPASRREYRDPDTHGSILRERPQCAADISETTFRIRRWAYFRAGLPIFEGGGNEAISTYATLDPSLYTPTKEKPYQGIWVGDYSAHGCEFLLFLQTNPKPATTAATATTHNYPSTHHARDLSQSSRPTSTSATDEPTKSGFDHEPADEYISQGSLVGVKLTGDPNVPRGEISIIAEDISDAGLLRVADEEPFRGARIVASKGHLAGLGFHDDIFIPSQLILISPDTIAHYWVAMGHVSYFRRVDVDALLRESFASRSS